MQNWIEQILQDLFHAVRILRKSSGSTIIIIVILALGTGVNTAVFTILNAVVLRPLPFSEPARLYQITCQSSAFVSDSFSSDAFHTWRDRTRVFEAMALTTRLTLILSDVAEPEQISGMAVSRECLPMLGVSPILGRLFVEEDFNAASQKTVIISSRLWHRQFNRDPKILGRAIKLDGRDYTVIAVMPPSFQFMTRDHLFWLPAEFRLGVGGGKFVYARANAGITHKQIQAESQVVSQIVKEIPFPGKPANWYWRASILSLQDVVYGDFRLALLLMQGAVVFVLMIACLNVSNILLVNGMARAKEIAIRSVLGATRVRIMRQLFIESLLLTSAGGILGFLLACWSFRMLFTLLSDWSILPRLEQASIDGKVLAFTLLIVLGSSLISGLLPAFQGSKLDLNEILKTAEIHRKSCTSPNRFRDWVMIAEIALSLVLLSGAALMLRSFHKLTNVDPGFNAKEILIVRLPLSSSRYGGSAHHYSTELLHRVQALPGVRSAALSTAVPLTGDQQITSLHGNKESRIFPVRAVSPQYFRIMGIPILKGRDIADTDTRDSPTVVIVNQTLARQVWPGGDPVGRKLGMNLVVGLVGDIRHKGLSIAPEAEIFIPYPQQLASGVATLVVKTNVDPLSMAAAIRNCVRDAAADQPVEIATMEQIVANSVSQPRAYTLMLGAFGVLALLLAATGVFGVTSYVFSQRSHEIGVRMALGAQDYHILLRMLRDGAVHVLIGIAIGLGGAVAATRLMSNMLYGVSPTDPLMYALASFVMAVCSLGAIYIPAKRALKRDPLASLRLE